MMDHRELKSAGASSGFQADQQSAVRDPVGLWKEFWERFPGQFSRCEFMRQVGKTYRGQPISRNQLNMIVEDVVRKLNLQKDDVVLDLCCGNGLITSAIAKKCRHVAGVDFSEFLIGVAREFSGASNLCYYCLPALEMTPEIFRPSIPFTKIYMYESLQHFREDQLAPLLATLRLLSNEKTAILLASVPHKRKMLNFYNTAKLRSEFRERKRKGSLELGTWWNQSDIREICAAFNLRCRFLPQPDGLHTAHYRFDVRIIR
jgi:2-polyprenyl-3-methyl-5-hydroxy-6-metoxy-1,4-benzoquinol methylase